jgi:hypothetical protein
MADGFLEKHYEDYEARKAAWLQKKKHLSKTKNRNIERPENEAL